MRKIELPHYLKYLSVVTIGALLDFFTVSIFFYFRGEYLLSGLICGFLVGLSSNFVLHKIFTFANYHIKAGWIKIFTRFVVSSTATILVRFMLIELLIFPKMTFWEVQFIVGSAMLISLTINYALLKTFVFLEDY